MSQTQAKPNQPKPSESPSLATNIFVTNIFGGNLGYLAGTSGPPETWCGVESLSARQVKPSVSPATPPFRPANDPLFTGSDYPIEMTLNDLCFLFWNVKTFALTTPLIFKNRQQSELAGIGTIYFEFDSQVTSVVMDSFPTFSERICSGGYIVAAFPFSQSATAELIPDPGSGLDPAFVSWSYQEIPVNSPNFNFFGSGAQAGYYPNPDNPKQSYFYPNSAGSTAFGASETPPDPYLNVSRPFVPILGIGFCPNYSFGQTNPDDSAWTWAEVGFIEIIFPYSQLKELYPTQVPSGTESASFKIPLFGATGYNRNQVATDDFGNPIYNTFRITETSVSQNMVLTVSDLSSLT